ncbi:MAG: ATP-grasp domain-containing protein, partial [Alphaproteobacteria bacterium]|nr:ATP-grasp domain-containing protein [Alphaproteobacteria bacterium]
MTLAPNDITLGILGGGQLGRMSAMAASRLGIRAVIFTEDENSPASHVAYKTIVAQYDDEKALDTFRELVDVITYEFENIPVETIHYLESNGMKVLPDKSLLDVSQNRIKEKQFLNDIGISTAKWKKIEKQEDLWSVGFQDFIIKTTRFGYDGKGQIASSLGESKACKNLEEFFKTHIDNELILEEKIDFTEEISVIIARDQNGNTSIYGPMQNIHKNHILHKTIFPAKLGADITKKAHEISKKIADKINL